LYGLADSWASILIGYSVKTVMVIVLYAYMWSVNKKRDREAAADARGVDELEQEAIEKGMRDMTEIDNKGFRYSL
jgi:cbb3-type cytochrome oxidase subunit 3